MKRSEFLKSLGFGVAVLTVSPTLFTNEPVIDKFEKSQYSSVSRFSEHGYLISMEPNLMGARITVERDGCYKSFLVDKQHATDEYLRGAIEASKKVIDEKISTIK